MVGNGWGSLCRQVVGSLGSAELKAGARVDRVDQLVPKLQLVGVTAMLIASKYEEIYPPIVTDFVYITDNAYSKKEILEMEESILCSLEFSVHFTS